MASKDAHALICRTVNVSPYMSNGYFPDLKNSADLWRRHCPGGLNLVTWVLRNRKLLLPSLRGLRQMKKLKMSNVLIMPTLALKREKEVMKKEHKNHLESQNLWLTPRKKTVLQWKELILSRTKQKKKYTFS